MNDIVGMKTSDKVSKVWDVHVDRKGIVNLAALENALRAELKDVVGVSTGPCGVRVHLGHEPTPEEIKLVRGVLQKHRDNAQTAEQQAFQARRERIAAISSKPWDALTAAEREQVLRLLYEQFIYQETGKLPPQTAG